MSTTCLSFLPTRKIIMADMADTLVESALKSLETIAETGGFMKKETKDEMLQAVSVIRNYFDTVNTTGEDENPSMKNPRKQAEEAKTNMIQGEGSRFTRQVAPSVDPTTGAVSGERRELSSDGPANQLQQDSRTNIGDISETTKTDNSAAQKTQ